ncbi:MULTISPECIES: methylated-DNA--[protein]-cysteine S-methyltransferase [Sanguibacteroides]|uniref:Methylated-DNA--protein-cysteine methyltransferase n=1 Tax=Sanguibacteroides justesenii TaxID=1547597 RepID=A0AB34R810_9PORP|nr:MULTISPECIES: methylated-DNA--[protein]-cysteine S-methyltransferase [Sanguibacteroides]KIO46220.1 cysteine methyltransferase [Sanguibacteroides justesenii]PXZ44283.1 methylated-DNA--[protein]-cysteine S-methyltransferase [Sanguibacteroides justesenii]
MQAKYAYNGLIGKYYLVEKDGRLVRLWLGDRVSLAPAEIEMKETPLIREAKSQLDAYFDKRLQVFDLPLAPEGTLFQMKIWELLRSIPYGCTITYGELAERAGDKNACRAVGMANGRNPLPVFIPCHRVVGAGGKLTGYTGGLEVKMKLLRLEGIEWL